MKKKLLFILLIITTIQIHGMDLNWYASWISTEQCQSATNTWLIYRKEINIESELNNLEAKIAADSKYWLWINDQMIVFEGGLKRGPALHATYFDEVDIAPYLNKGKNTISLLVWHFGKDGFSHYNSGKAGLLFQAISPEVNIISDESWSCAVYDAYQNTEAPHPNFRLPESNIRFDARNEIENWNLSSFDGELPKAEIICKAEEMPFGKLVKRPIPQWKDFGLKDYISTTKSTTGDTIFCKLPYNAQVTSYLKIKAPEGEKIHILTDHYRGGGTESVRAEYITKEGVQSYENLGWMNGHYVIYTIPENIEVLELKYRETGYNTEVLGSFECNDKFYNDLWEKSARTLYVTMRDTYMDCPDRERAQWWGDEVNELGEAFYIFDKESHKLAIKGIYELINWQKEDGVLFSPIPAGNWNKELPMQMLASIGWYGFYTQYFFSNDSSFIPHVYEGMKKYLHEVIELDNEGLVIHREGAWSWGDWGENIDMGVLFNTWYYLALKAEKEFALILNKPTDVAHINNIMSKIEANFNTRYWNGSAYRSPDYIGETDDRSQAMAVLSGLAEKEKFPYILKVFKEEFHASPYMEKYVLEALFEMDEAEYALERMKKRYTKMMQYTELTTLFEGWGIGPDGFGGGTTNHAWSGSPLTLLSRYVCGIAPVEPGFKTFTVNPKLGQLNKAQAVIPTEYGLISIQIEKNKKHYSTKLIVPQGTQAKVKGKLYKPGTYKLKISL